MKTESREMRCLRCQHLRWPTLPFSEPYVCRRCLAVLAGRNAIDRLANPERVARMKGNTLRKAVSVDREAITPADPMRGMGGMSRTPQIACA
jgi:hypothetical protein